MNDAPPKRLIVGISGASGAIYGIRVLELLRKVGGVETHLILSEGARATIACETNRTADDVRALADVVHSDRNLGAPLSSGSFQTIGMIVVPCSIRTLSGITHSYDANLMVRAADVCLKERRKLVLVVRETPLHAGHLKLMLAATELGAVIAPPMPAFYNLPQTVDDIVTQTAGRALDQFGFDTGGFTRWGGNGENGTQPNPVTLPT